MAPLTKNQYEVLTFVCWYKNKHGYTPSYSVICDEFGWTTKSTAFYFIHALETKKYLKVLPHKQHGIVILKQPS